MSSVTESKVDVNGTAAYSVQKSVRGAKLKLIRFMKSEDAALVFGNLTEFRETLLEAKNEHDVSFYKRVISGIWTNKIQAAVRLGKLEQKVSDVFSSLNVEDQHIFAAHVLCNVFKLLSQ